MHSTSPTLEDLERQDRDLVLSAFALDDAWWLGSWLTNKAIAQDMPLAIDIRRADLVVFRSVLPGATPDQEVWLARKSAVTLRMEVSSLLFAARLAERQIDARAVGWLDERYAITGGSVPVRVAGVGVVAAVTAAGLSSTADHDFVVEGIEALRASQSLTSASEDKRAMP